MSWLSDLTSNIVRSYSDISAFTSSLGGLIENPISDFWKDTSQKADLRGAQLEGFASGLPVVGDVIRGAEGVTQMEDLYNRTGKVPAYPGSQSLGTGSLGHSLSEALNRKIEDGTHDLYQFYSGASDDTAKQIMRPSNWNSRYHYQDSIRMW